MRSSVRAIDVPLAASLAIVAGGVQVDIVVDGHNADRMMLYDGGWRAVRINAPASTGPFWRVDLEVRPTWIPRVVVDSSDERELGIAVGEISVLSGEKRISSPVGN